VSDEALPTAVGQAKQAATVAGVVTIVAGAALTVAPARCGKPIGMEDHPGVMRAIGISDLIVAPGLLAARPRWPWLLARAAMNVGLVAGALKYRNELGDRNSRIGVVTFAVLTVVDGAAAAVLRGA